MLLQEEQKQASIFEKLASGKKINRAADIGAAHQIIDRLTAQVEGNRQSISNAYNGIALAQATDNGSSSMLNQANIAVQVQAIQQQGQVLSLFKG
ncbi:MAG: flagellin [Paraglaciecola sp.]